MIIIETAYPCTSCKEEINPLDAHCKFCGSKQPNLNERIHYNIFYLPKHRENDPTPAYNPYYGGTPILEFADIKELVDQLGGGYEGYEYFIGSYIPTQQTPGHTIKMASWQHIIGVVILKDVGPQEILITNLE